MAQALRAALVRIGLTQEAATFTTDTMLLNSLERWRIIHLDDDLIDFVKSLRSPAGTIMQAGVEVRHPGFQVSLFALSNLKVMRLALKHYQLIQRPVVPADITLQWIGANEFLVNHAIQARRNTANEEDLPVIRMNDWAQTKERINTHMSGMFGIAGTPLAYVLRDEAAVPPHLLDPQIRYEGDYIREMIRRVAHIGPDYEQDNRDVCRLIRIMAGDTAAYAYIMEYTANGRAAWVRLMSIYLGPQHTQNQASIYEAKIQHATYEGETNRFGYDKYMEIHKTAHSRLAALVPYGYTGMDEGTKIRHFLNGITTDKLKTVVELVRNNANYNTFELVARRIKDSVDLMKPARIARRQVADLRVNQPFADVEADMNVEDKYYKPKDWAKLSAAKKKGVLAKRAKRGGGTGAASAGPRGTKRKISKLSKKQLTSLARQVAALNVDGDVAESAVDDQAPPNKKAATAPTAANNRRNPALKRPGQD